MNLPSWNFDAIRNGIAENIANLELFAREKTEHMRLLYEAAPSKIPFLRDESRRHLLCLVDETVDIFAAMMGDIWLFQFLRDCFQGRIGVFTKTTTQIEITTLHSNYADGHTEE